MVGRSAVRAVCLASVLVLGGSACGSSALDRRPAPPASTQPAIDGNVNSATLAALGGDTPEQMLPTGVSLYPIRIPTFVFGPGTPVQSVRTGSLALAGLVPSHPRLHVVALPSP